MRLTPTNSGADNKGVVRIGPMMVEGNAYLVLVIGAVVGLFAFIVANGRGCGWGARILYTAIPLGCALGWVKFFVMGRPPAFQSDFFQRILVGRDFNLQPQEWAKPSHPLGKRVRGTTSS